MKHITKIVLSGVGGQGLVSCGYILGNAATKQSSKYAVLLSSYGSEARGTFTKTDIIISDKPISFLEIEEPQLVVSLAQVGYDRYYKSMKKNTIMIYDSGLVKPDSTCIANQYGFPFERIATEVGYSGAANLVAAGFMIKLTGILEVKAVEDTIRNRYSSNAKILDTNIKAFKGGLQLEAQY